MLKVMKEAKGGKNVGVFGKDNFPGEFCESWKAAFKEANFEKVDVSAALAYIMAPKEESEIVTIKKACLVTIDVYQKYLKDQIMEIIDADKKVKHAKLSEGVEQALSDKKYVSGVDTNHLDTCYPAIIQSGGNYSLKYSVISDKNIIHFGAIVCSLGARYKSYCSNISRTLLVNPTDAIQENYNFLLNLEEELLKLMVPGKKLCDIYEAGLAYAKKEKPTLVDSLTKMFGFAMGIEFRESSIIIGPKCNAIVKKGMVFNLYVGLSPLTNSEATDKEGKTYALFIGDTILVNEEGPASVLTQLKKKIKNVGIFVKDDEENDDDEDQNDQEKPEEIVGRGKRTTVLDSKLRSEHSTEEKRKQHQKELAVQLNERAKERLDKQSGVKEAEKTRKNMVSYKSVSQMPRESEVKELKLFVGELFCFSVELTCFILVLTRIETGVNIFKSVSRLVDLPWYQGAVHK